MNELSNKNPEILTRVAVKDTILTIAPGESAKFDCRSFAAMTSAAAVISRINKDAGRVRYTIASDDNGVTYTISCNS